MSNYAQKFVDVLRGANGKHQAVTGKAIALRIGATDARAVRNLLAAEREAITAALSPAILMCAPPDGYWTTSDADEIKALYQRAAQSERAARLRKKQIIAEVKAAGFAGILAMQGGGSGE